MAFCRHLNQCKGIFSKMPKYLYFSFYLRSKSKIGPYYPCLPYKEDFRIYHWPDCKSAIVSSNYYNSGSQHLFHPDDHIIRMQLNMARGQRGVIQPTAATTAPAASAVQR